MVVNWDERGSRSTKQRSTPNVQRRTLNKERRSAGQRIPARRICHSASREPIPMLLSNRLRESVFYLCAQWDRHRPAIYRICIKIMVRTVTLQITAAFSETSYELSPLHSEIAISCLSFGTNVLSAASSTISR